MTFDLLIDLQLIDWFYHYLLLLLSQRSDCPVAMVTDKSHSTPLPLLMVWDVRGQSPGGRGSAGQQLGHQWAGQSWRKAPPPAPEGRAGLPRPPLSWLVQTSAQVWPYSASAASLDQSESSRESAWQQVFRGPGARQCITTMRVLTSIEEV